LSWWRAIASHRFGLSSKRIWRKCLVINPQATFSSAVVR
jgi:hypothetical protein